MLTRIVRLGGLLAVALLAQPVGAQTFYKSTMPDGRVVYGDKPAPGAVKVDESRLDSAKRGVVPPSAGEKATLKQLEQSRKTREMAQDRIRGAEIALHNAEVAQSMGKEPQPDERQGTASGNQRLTDAYWARQKRLEQNVETARANLEKIRAGK